MPRRAPSARLTYLTCVKRLRIDVTLALDSEGDPYFDAYCALVRRARRMTAVVDTVIYKFLIADDLIYRDGACVPV
ncbi:hypothetical protein HYPSUDRAFT_37480 [Hypholoma sublateritium FD-334 SS-4]|uniref:Uncharacterized protein n=1 Tax=Hypholoma sublateritium (strain FD-334 SS-4) TaxID=945553 RepID=A0A0D2PA52_HYPSF|nr:hypothetical protein HYPSUDRAFT_37480 [Hypholoma sublateritium FD-334 SS-4]